MVSRGISYEAFQIRLKTPEHKQFVERAGKEGVSMTRICQALIGMYLRDEIRIRPQEPVIGEINVKRH